MDSMQQIKHPHLKEQLEAEVEEHFWLQAQLSRMEA
jgi:hypothetical protein